MTHGRNKGARAELEVAALLEAWWRQIEPECTFKRTPGSGGWAAPEVRGEFETSGDLVTTAARFPFSVEVKRRESWVWNSVVMGRGSPVWGWWLQTQTAAAEMKKEPMLWFRKNREPWRIMLRADFAARCYGGALAGIAEKAWLGRDLTKINYVIFPIVVNAERMLALPARHALPR